MEELDLAQRNQLCTDVLTSQGQSHRVPGGVLSTSMQDLSQSHSNPSGYSPGFEKTEALGVDRTHSKCQSQDSIRLLAPEASLLTPGIHSAEDLDLEQQVGFILQS